MGNDIIKAEEVLRSWVSANIIVLSTPIIDIKKDEPELDIAWNLSQNVWDIQVC